MDNLFDNIWSNLMISCLAMALFMYGKKAQRPYPLIAGISMCVYPFFVNTALMLWLITGGILAVLFFLRGK